MNTELKLAALLAFGFLMVGCAAPIYSAKVTNLTDQPVTATLWEQGEGASQPRVRRFIGPQNNFTLRVKSKHGRTVWLGVDFQGNEGRPQELPLSRGLTVVNVRRVDEGSRGRIQLQEVQ